MKTYTYHQLTEKVLKEGQHANGYTQLQHVMFEFSACKRGVLYLPTYRLDRKTPIKYGIAESVWYMKGTRKVDWIAQYGSIWNRMVDYHKNCNSNYGYQLRYNQSLNTKLRLLALSGSACFEIVSTVNQHSLTDLVCNQFVEVTYHKEQQLLNMRVIARSIDLMFGLPYDMFAAQALMNLLAQGIESMTGLAENTIKCGTLVFEIVNCHLYDRDVHDVKQQLQEQYGHIDEYTAIPFSATGFAKTSQQIDELMSNDIKMKELIQLAQKNSRRIECKLVTNDYEPRLNEVKTFATLNDFKSFLKESKRLLNKHRKAKLFILRRLSNGTDNTSNRKLIDVDATGATYYSIVQSENYPVKVFRYQKGFCK